MEVVRRLYKAFNAADYQASLNLMSPDIEYHESLGCPAPGKALVCIAATRNLRSGTASF